MSRSTVAVRGMLHRARADMASLLGQQTTTLLIMLAMCERFRQVLGAQVGLWAEDEVQAGPFGEPDFERLETRLELGRDACAVLRSHSMELGGRLGLAGCRVAWPGASALVLVGRERPFSGDELEFLAASADLASARAEVARMVAQSTMDLKALVAARFALLRCHDVAKELSFIRHLAGKRGGPGLKDFERIKSLAAAGATSLREVVGLVNPDVSSERVGEPVVDAVNEAVGEVCRLRESASVSVSGSIPGEQALVPFFVRSVLVNLIDNAVLESGASCDVRIRAATPAGMVIIEVANPMRAARSHPPIADEGERMGVALSLSQKLMEAAAGSLRCSRGQGGQFVVRLQIPIVGAADQPATTERSLDPMEYLGTVPE